MIMIPGNDGLDPDMSRTTPPSSARQGGEREEDRAYNPHEREQLQRDWERDLYEHSRQEEQR